MNLRSRFLKARGRALLLAVVSLLLLAAAPVFAVSTGLVHFPSSAIQAEGPSVSPDETDGANNDVQDGTQNQVGPDATDGANNDVQDGTQNQVGPDETDGPNSDVQDGAQNQDGTDQQDQPAPGG